MKDKVIEKEGKFYKECGVVMLETTNGISHILINPLNGVLYHHEQSCDIGAHKLQHLYITSDDEIKEGDWFSVTYEDRNKTIITQAYTAENTEIQTEKDGRFDSSLCRKVIATTDTSLYQLHDNGLLGQGITLLPQPSEGFIKKFIEAYNKGEKIEKVLVEYEANGLNQRCVIDSTSGNDSLNWVLKLKDNNIIIKKIDKSQRDWDEIQEAFITAMKIDPNKDVYTHLQIAFQWFKENL